MAKVDIEGVLDHCRSELKSALRYALQQQQSREQIDANALFRAFARAAGRRCGTADVPDRLVKTSA